MKFIFVWLHCAIYKCICPPRMPCFFWKNSDKRVNKFKLWDEIHLSPLKLRHHVITYVELWMSQCENSLFFLPTTLSNFLPPLSMNCVPALTNGILPPSTNSIVPRSKNSVLLPSLMNGVLPPLKNSVPHPSSSFLWRMAPSLEERLPPLKNSSLSRRTTPSFEERLPPLKNGSLPQ